MAIAPARGLASGKQGRRRSLCNLFAEATIEANAIGKPWWQAGMTKRSHYAREGRRPTGQYNGVQMQ